MGRNGDVIRMRWARNAWLAAVGLLALIATRSESVADDTKPRISLELLTKPGLPLTASQQWYKSLTALGISGLQIHAARPGDESKITQQGTKNAPEYRVVGILSADNVLYLPGGKFNLNDNARLRKWLDNLGDQGAEGVTQPRSAFGLVPRQLEDVNNDLKRPVTFTTKNASTAKVVEQIGGQLKFPMLFDAGTHNALHDVKQVEDLSGMSAGTALAIALRPAGLVLAPERPTGGLLQYRVAKAQAGREAWPIGWKPHEPPNKVLPDLFAFLNVEIKDIPVSEALEAIEGRLKTPFLYDHNAMALHGVDPSQTQADVPSKRMTYSQTLRRVLAQAMLRYELRMDEAERPFLWITTIKPVQ